MTHLSLQTQPSNVSTHKQKPNDTRPTALFRIVPEVELAEKLTVRLPLRSMQHQTLLTLWKGMRGNGLVIQPLFYRREKGSRASLQMQCDEQHQWLPNQNLTIENQSIQHLIHRAPLSPGRKKKLACFGSP